MDLKEVIQKRKSVRSFLDDDVPDLTEIIDLAKRCPSAGGIRGYKVVETREQVGPYKAPRYLVICSDPMKYSIRYGARGIDLYAIQDSAILAAYIQLLLVDAGLSSCWIGAFREGRVARQIGTDLRPVALLAVGYAGA